MRVRLGASTVVFVLAAFLVAAGPHLLAIPAWLGVFVLAGVAWRGAAEFRGWRPPGRLVRIGVTFLGLGLVIAAYGTLWGRRAATALLCVMLASKLLEMYRLRDGRMVAALSFFLVATQFLFSQRLELVVWLLAACWLATIALLRIQRDEDAPRAGTGSATAPVRSTIRGAAAMMLLALPFALVLFVLFPRLASPLWGLPEEALDGRTGLSDEMSVGEIASLFEDDSPAFRVTFQGEPPPRSELYWRGPVLWRFDGRTWTRVFYVNQAPERVPDVGPGALRYTVQIEPTERRWLFALDHPARWPDRTRVSMAFELLRDEPLTALTPYDVISQPDFVDTPTLLPLYRNLALDLPEDSNPRTRRYARELRERFPDDDAALIGEVLRWFNEGPFYYSLDTAPLGRHGADEFLFDLRTGYCEYYASAFAVLMRHAGIPTRVVTGYQGGYWQAADEYLLVRNSDAHAWNEVWLEGRGWTRVDPTSAVSPTRILDGARSALPGAGGWLSADWAFQLRNQYDRLQHLWNRWVLGFDADRQESMLRRLGLQTLGLAGQAALMVAAILLLAPLAWWLRGLLAGARRTPDPLVRAWRRVEQRLGRAGPSRRAHETVREWMPRAAATLQNRDELLALADRYQRLRYGPDPADAAIRTFVERCRRWRPRFR
ncbi:transglutaminase TgpA family protein [Halomonas denitrificans]|nr:DUF3488 and transglutaminase-like domain-containing protein [Halomonas denitrificans]